MRRKAIAEQEHLDKLRKLRRRIVESGESPEEYMLLLEKQLRVFEGIHQKLSDALDEVDRLNGEIENLHGEITALTQKTDELNAEIARLERKYIDDMAELRAEHERELSELNDSHREQVQALLQSHAEEIAELNDNWQAQIDYIAQQHKNDLDEMREKYDIAVARAVARLNTLAEYCLPYVKLGGRFIAYKGECQSELEESKKRA